MLRARRLSQPADLSRLSRRAVLRGGAAALSAGLAGIALPRPVRAEGGVLTLTAEPFQHGLYPESGALSDLWGFNGQVPGPEIRVGRDERVRVRLINRLEEPTSIHWHGVRIANGMDGVAGLTQEPVPPGGTFDYDFEVPDAGTYWYHAHAKSWNQVGRGLYGPLIIEGDTPEFDRDHDLVLIADDWRLDQDGRFDAESLGSLRDWSHAGRLGNWLTVNGISNPEFDLVAGEAYRLRLTNASNARILEIDPRRIGGTLVALDGQPLAHSEAFDADVLSLGPGQRIDVVVVPEPGRDLSLTEISTDRPFEFARFKVTGSGPSDRPAIPVLRPNALTAPNLAEARTVVLDMTGGAMGGMGEIRYRGELLDRDAVMRTGQVWAFNGVANRSETPLFSAPRGETIILEIRNQTAWPHAMHTHGHHFQVLTSDDSLGPWRDTVLIVPRDTIRITLAADNPGKWLFHCHMLEHAAAGMNTWFEVT